MISQKMTTRTSTTLRAASHRLNHTRGRRNEEESTERSPRRNTMKTMVWYRSTGLKIKDAIVCNSCISASSSDLHLPVTSSNQLYLPSLLCQPYSLQCHSFRKRNNSITQKCIPEREHRKKFDFKLLRFYHKNAFLRGVDLWDPTYRTKRNTRWFLCEKNIQNDCISSSSYVSSNASISLSTSHSRWKDVWVITSNYFPNCYDSQLLWTSLHSASSSRNAIANFVLSAFSSTSQCTHSDGCSSTNWGAHSEQGYNHLHCSSHYSYSASLYNPTCIPHGHHTQACMIYNIKTSSSKET